MEFIEISAKTVEDAITKASEELRLPSYQLEIQVISEGSTGFLGFGSKPAVIQVRKKEEEKPEAAQPENRPEKKAPAAKETKKAKEPRKNPEKKKPKDNTEIEEKPEKAEKPRVREPKEEKKYVVVERSDEEVVSMKAAAEEFLHSVFNAMEMPVELNSVYDAEAGSLDIEFSGADMGVLIGKRGQTLDSLQYLVSLVVNKNQKNYVRIKLDTEDYRRRRKDTLENLAKNIANKVRRNRKAVSLEAMNPYERRIIHSALQGNRYVETYSEGNEPYRHVVVVPKKN